MTITSQGLSDLENVYTYLFGRFLPSKSHMLARPVILHRILGHERRATREAPGDRDLIVEISVPAELRDEDAQLERHRRGHLDAQATHAPFNVQRAQPVRTSSAMLCPVCNNELEGAPRFCNKCGSKISVDAATLVPETEVSTDAFIGTTVGGRYKIVRLLGEGGMGAVYLGEQNIGGTVRKVAIKTLHQHLSSDPKILQRFERECATVAELQHPNTIQLYDFGKTDDGILYMVMEFVQGEEPCPRSSRKRGYGRDAHVAHPPADLRRAQERRIRSASSIAISSRTTSS